MVVVEEVEVEEEEVIASGDWRGTRTQGLVSRLCFSPRAISHTLSTTTRRDLCCREEDKKRRAPPPVRCRRVRCMGGKSVASCYHLARQPGTTGSGWLVGGWEGGVT